MRRFLASWVTIDWYGFGRTERYTGANGASYYIPSRMRLHGWPGFKDACWESFRS